MNFMDFLNPSQIQDTPRLFTAIAEWLAVFVYFNIYKKRRYDKIYLICCISTLFIQVAYQFLAGILPLGLWIPAMIGAVGLMYLSLYMVLDIKRSDCAVITTHAFVLAEFAASLYKQLHVWMVKITGYDGFTGSFLVP